MAKDKRSDILETDCGTARTTIVGGQPRVGTQKVQIPIGVERVLFLAARDRAFRKRLLKDVRSAVRSVHIDLRPSELAILEHTPPETLATVVRRFDPLKHSRRRFARAVAAAALSVASGTVSGSCSVSMGSRPDIPDGHVDAARVLDAGTDATGDGAPVPQNDARTDAMADDAQPVPDDGGRRAEGEDQDEDAGL